MPNTEQTAAELQQAVADALKRIEERKSILIARIAADRAELAALGVKRVRAEKPRRGRARGATNKPKAGTAPTAQELELRHNNAAEAGL